MEAQVLDDQKAFCKQKDMHPNTVLGFYAGYKPTIYLKEKNRPPLPHTAIALQQKK